MLSHGFRIAPERWRTTFTAVAAFLVLSACASLEPVDLPPEYTPAPAHAALWDAVLETRSGDWFALLNDGPESLDWRLRAIDSASETIDLQTFLWSLDRSGRLVFGHLLAAAERGVLVKLLVDDTFLLGEDEILLEVASHPNIEHRVFNPYKRRTSGFATRQALNLAEFHRLDHRMHNKAMIVDNRVAIVGGRNIADEYFGLHEEVNFRDLEVIAGGPVVTEVARSFDAYWNDHWSFPIELLSHVETSPADMDRLAIGDDEPVVVHAEESAEERLRRWTALAASAHSGRWTLIVDDPPDENPALASEAPVQVANALIERFDQARHEIIIVSAYLIPTPELEGAIERAVDRGVRVRLLTNSIRSNNHLTAHSAYRNHIETLLSHGAELHEVRVDASDRNRYMLAPVDKKELGLHAKTLLFDGESVFIGSANLDPRSLRINTEMGLWIDSVSLCEALRAVVAPDFERTNAWEVLFDDDGEVVWVSDTETRTTQPAASTMQRIEDWLFAHLPLEGEL